MSAGWVELAWYPGHFAADLHRALLESAGVPVLVKSSATGIFGPGFSGATPEGVRLFVPAVRVDEALELLSHGDHEEDGLELLSHDDHEDNALEQLIDSEDEDDT